MKKITLPKGVWQYDPSQMLGPRGGFGAVFAGYSDNLGEVAVKEIVQEAQREIRIADELLHNRFQHVIPIYDAGQDVETGVNYLVMARAEKSLQDHVRAVQVLSDQEAIDILLQIVSGLMEVPSLVHRDLKPGNILFHSGKWKIADFGIAKFIEESTSFQTLRECLTPSYAAPEQWNYEKPTNKVDIYALGCIGFAMLTGTPPFSGSVEDLKNLHLNHQPPIAKIVNPRLQTRISMMMRKTPETRPSLERIKVLLEQMKVPEGVNASSGWSALSNAAAIIAEKTSTDEAQRLTVKTAEEKRRKIAFEAREILSQIVSKLFQRTQNHAPNAIMSPMFVPNSGRGSFSNPSISLGDAELAFDFSHFSAIPEGAFKGSGWDVITGVIVKVTQKAGAPYVWSANLWFTNLGKGQEYRWWEVSYMTMALMRSHPPLEPYAVEDLADADIAAAPVMAHVQLGSRPKLIDDEYVENFCDRWADLLAKAVKGQIRFPSRLPID